MKNYCKKCRQLTLYFLVLFSCIVVGYALITQILTITGTSNIAGTWNVKITTIGTPTFTLGAANHTGSPPAVAGNGLSATFNVDLPVPGASATYPITIQNTGNIVAKLSSITGLTAANAAAPTDVTYSISSVGGVSGGTATSDVSTGLTDTLAANNGSVTYNVTATWSSAATSIPGTTSKSATLLFTYEQYPK